MQAMSRVRQIDEVVVIDEDMALKDYVRIAINLFAPRFDEDFDLNIAG